MIKMLMFDFRNSEKDFWKTNNQSDFDITFKRENLNENTKLTAKEKASYGLGAVGKDMVYMLSASYILYYYQDILGV